MNTIYVNGTMVNVRDIACDICEMFEELLDMYGIYIPDEDRDLNEDEGLAHLYGTNYATCEDAITSLLADVVKDISAATGESILIQENYNGSMGFMQDNYYEFTKPDKFEMNIDLDKIPDSMCLDSGTHICEYHDGNDKVEIDVRGYVTVDFNGERYRHYSDMPKELQELFVSGKAYTDERVVINENNWYEVFFNFDRDYDVAEVDGYIPDKLEEFCKECMELFRNKNKKNDFPKPFMLLSTCERNTTHMRFQTFEEAQEQMKKEFEMFGGDEEAIKSLMAEIGEWSAWITDGNNHDDYDWKIIDLRDN